MLQTPPKTPGNTGLQAGQLAAPGELDASPRRNAQSQTLGNTITVQRCPALLHALVVRLLLRQLTFSYSSINILLLII